MRIKRRRELAERLAVVLIADLLWLWMARLAVAQEGFLSIDCGSNVSYVDNTTGIRWVTDEGYIQTGENSSPGSKSNPDNETQLQDLRFFPNRTRNCYILPVDSNTTYLIRSTFQYLDFGSVSDTTVTFNLYLDTTFWGTVTYSLAPSANQDPITFQIMFRSNETSLSVCLVKQQGTPFISSLELRQLADSMYETVVKSGLGLLDYGYRYNLGVNPGTPGYSSYLRYPDDPFDRIWYNFGDSSGPPALSGQSCPATISNTSQLNLSIQADNRPPTKVMETACYGPGNHNMSLQLTFPTNVGEYYATLYLQELNDSVSASNPRELLSQVRGAGNDTPDNVTFLQEQIEAVDQLSGNYFEVTFSNPSDALLGPLVNAAEFFLTTTINNSLTNNVDANALTVLQRSFNLSSWTGDPCYPVSFDWLTCDYSPSAARVTQITLTGMGIAGVIPSALAGLTQLTSLSLDNNKLEGPIPNLRNLTKLQTLNLENNSLEGAFPSYLFEAANLTGLYVENNTLTGSVPACPKERAFTYRCDGNPGLRCPTGTQQCSDDSSSNSTKLVLVVIFACLGGVAFASILVGSCLIHKRRKQRRVLPPSQPLPGKSPRGLKTGEGSDLQSSITFQEIINATRNFERKIGEGSFGSVYYGRLSDGQEVAVKTNAGSTRQGEAEFLNEVNLLSRVHHKSLVSLIGYCSEAEELLLVYAYMSNLTLREHLYGTGRSRLDWITRLDIAVSSAKGLEYLHTACNPRIIHRDVKSSNILLDDKFVAKVADFGLSKSAPDFRSTSGFYTNLKGTPGYFDPEYFVTERLTQKSDVYSFGIVLLEIISGRAPYPQELPDYSLRTVLDWMRSSLETDIFVIVDSFLEDKYKPESMRMVIELAAACTSQRGINRPDMSKVVQDLLLARSLESGHSHTSQTDTSLSRSGSISSLSPLNPPVPSIATMSVDYSYGDGR